MTSRSLLSVVEAADVFPSYPLPPSAPPAPYVPFHLTLADHLAHLPPLGLLRPDVLREMKKVVATQSPEPLWEFYEGEGKPDETGNFNRKTECVYFDEKVVEGGKEVLAKRMAEVAQKWREEGVFPLPLGGWRNELYSIYASPQSSAFKSLSKPSGTFSNLAFPLERAACAIFGLATFGVHLTAYEGEGEDMKVWVPRRSKTKATWPGRLDNSVAGGITSGMTPLETIVKECDEEANLPEDLVRKHVKATGVLSYFYVTDDGYLQPEVEYIYDLPLPPSDSPEYVKPAPHDDEVESFALMTIPELVEALHGHDMKPNCGLVYVDFLVRHGFVTPETEPNFMEISWKMHRKLGVPMPM
ncbi:hypothetical protein CI109_106822 [Kwoniella shandongensis]|uniref:Uncharacterized protein n=1 Tax=Kwoniella shandongensis TaxID=1734106 RepID=A0A5M6C784_9TREE|nr:uncharacterized protein CI109_000921 [Kwoniella shandongensis]KAA5530741.1 hypothetical protein CI109_000921 [Kwoniella shandongensis]